MKKSSFKEESHITTALRLVYKLSLLFEEKAPYFIFTKNNQANQSNSRLAITLGLIYKLSVLLEEKRGGGGGEYSSSVRLSLQGDSRA